MSINTGLDPQYLARYHESGFAVIRGVFGAGEVREMAAAFERVHARAMAHPRSFRHQNVYFHIAEDARLGRIVRLAQWPAYFDACLERVRREPLLGPDIKQIINQLHWKPPGAARAAFGYHQDIAFRRPPEAYRNPGGSYVQTAIAVDPQRADNGALKLYPGSHKLGALAFPDGGRVMDRPLRDEDLAAAGLDPAKLVDLVLEPGDVAFWNLYTVHGSGPNTSPSDRRLYLNGYVAAADCDRGEWAFRGGEPCALGDPVLVHYEDLFARPEPHYVED
jgi:ectoine hydroxylase-related dioxygenase (phytanoyl-CoA dioxygenase family)